MNKWQIANTHDVQLAPEHTVEVPPANEGDDPTTKVVQANVVSVGSVGAARALVEAHNAEVTAAEDRIATLESELQVARDQ